MKGLGSYSDVFVSMCNFPKVGVIPIIILLYCAWFFHNIKLIIMVIKRGRERVQIYGGEGTNFYLSIISTSCCD